MAETCLETERLILRNWREEDREMFHRLNSDEQVMQFFPFRRDRKQSDSVMDELHLKCAIKGFGFCPMVLKQTGQAIGFCGLSEFKLANCFPEGGTEIGWRLVPEYWQNGYVTEAARRWIEFGFEELKLEEIVSFAVPQNFRSIAVMERLGFRHDPSRDFDHPSVPDDHQHLKRHVLYSLKRPQGL